MEHRTDEQVEPARTIEASLKAPAQHSQFDLKTIFLFTTSWSIFLFLLAAWSFVGAFCMTMFALLILATIISSRPGLSPNQVLGRLIGIMGLVVIVGWPLSTDIRNAGESANRNACSSNLCMLATALQMYQDTYSSWPPAYIADEKGRPMHSWRVLILPFIEQHALYQQYDFSEPWNGPNNIKLVARRPDIFRCPSVSEDGVTTSYVAIVGPETTWPEAKACSFAEVSDGMSNTLLLAEIRDSGIAWTEPRDLHTTQMARSINPEQGQGISSNHRVGACVAFADRHVDWLPGDIPAERLRAYITRAGGEKIDPFLGDR